MSGRTVGIAILAVALLAGAALYYLQVYHYYEDVSDGVGGVRLATADGAAVEIGTAELTAIDADSSPIRFRACFSTTADPRSLAASLPAYPFPEPLRAPGWFDCYDAGAIAAALEAGEARAFRAVADTPYGIDRVVALTDRGRGYVWQQLNRCGTALYDGDPLPFGCPPPPDG